MKTMYICGQFGVPDEDRCRELVKQGHDVLVSSYSYEEVYKWALNNDLHIKIIQRGPRKGSYFFRHIRSYFSVLDTIQYAPDICIVYSYQRLAFFVSAVVARLMGALTVSMNDSMFDDYVRFIITDILKVFMLMPYSASLAATQKAASYARYLGIRKTKLYYCAIDVTRVRSAMSGVGIPFPDRNFISVARFIEKKNHLLMLDAFEIFVRQTGSQRRMIFCGYGPLEKEIRARIARSKILTDQVEIMGYLPVDEVARQIEQSVGLLLPSYEEQFGIVVTEAFAVGIPVVVTPYCGASELVSNGINGFVVELGNPVALALAMTKLQSNELEWNSMREAAKKDAYKADTTVFVNALNELYQEKHP